MIRLIRFAGFRRHLWRVYLFFFLIISIKAIANAQSSIVNIDTPDVSIIQLIAVPEKFSGKYIRVIGYLEYDEGSAVLYLNSLDAEHGIDKNALWLYPIKTLNPKPFDGKYVIVQGVFNGQDKGHWNIASGSLKNVNRIEATRN